MKTNLQSLMLHFAAYIVQRSMSSFKCRLSSIEQYILRTYISIYNYKLQANTNRNDGCNIPFAALY